MYTVQNMASTIDVRTLASSRALSKKNIYIKKGFQCHFYDGTYILTHILIIMFLSNT